VCTTDRTSLQSAVDAYTTLEGRPPAAIADLVPTYLRTAPVGYQIDATGQVATVPGGPCA
jgi:hypothetical protein